MLRKACRSWTLARRSVDKPPTAHIGDRHLIPTLRGTGAGFEPSLPLRKSGCHCPNQSCTGADEPSGDGTLHYSAGCGQSSGNEQQQSRVALERGPRLSGDTTMLYLHSTPGGGGRNSDNHKSHDLEHDKRYILHETFFLNLFLFSMVCAVSRQGSAQP